MTLTATLRWSLQWPCSIFMETTFGKTHQQVHGLRHRWSRKATTTAHTSTALRESRLVNTQRHVTATTLRPRKRRRPRYPRCHAKDQQDSPFSRSQKNAQNFEPLWSNHTCAVACALREEEGHLILAGRTPTDDGRACNTPPYSLICNIRTSMAASSACPELRHEAHGRTPLGDGKRELVAAAGQATTVARERTLFATG